MTDDDEAMYARPTGTRMERAQAIMSRAHCMRPEAAETDEARAARQAADKAKQARHDALFGREYVDVGTLLPLSRKLASQLGFNVEPADNGHGDMGMMGDPDQSPRPVLNYGDED